jgi:chaperone modulatory protein CbpM
MITLEMLCLEVRGLRAEDVLRWIAHEWVRAEPQDGGYAFSEIDVARVRLIRELRNDMLVNEEALPVVLSLLDQIYDMRRRMRRMQSLLDETMPQDLRVELVRRLREMKA